MSHFFLFLMVLREYLFTLQIKIIVTHRPLSFCWSSLVRKRLDYPWRFSLHWMPQTSVIQLKLTCPLVLLSFCCVVAIPAHLNVRWAYCFYRRVRTILRRSYSVSTESCKSYFAFFSFRDLSIFIVTPLICPVSIRLLISAALSRSCFFKIDSRLTWKNGKSWR